MVLMTFYVSIDCLLNVNSCFTTPNLYELINIVILGNLYYVMFKKNVSTFLSEASLFVFSPFMLLLIIFLKWFFS